MWFARFFKRRVHEAADDEPARFPVVQLPSPDAAMRAHGAPKAPAQAAVKGFDPYNSGSFERRNAWERVNKR
jgi:hypothetical protein